MDDIKTQIFSTPLLKVLDIILNSSDRELSDAEIASLVTGAKKSAVNNSLAQIAKMGVIKRSHIGRRCVNSLNLEHAWIPHFKIASNILAITPLVEQLKKNSSKIILFGSRASGTNRHDSDFDLFVITTEPGEISHAIRESPIDDRIQFVTKTPYEALSMEDTDPVLMQNIREGIILWEK